MSYGLESKKKTYVPLHGSYEAFERRVVHDAFFDFTRGT